ncbi:NADH dehydrogenase [ubiquinone] 1 beta subcomplex subunit 8, mitochondrial [Penaeus vannamei]|uniref:NADH dehydrogenase [ubiquinone] 1 beta subcomplex subunit 8, mitochondrial n=1 Tax=Penaeus vannamei TaxID=6689 RepID=UPI00387FA8BB
MSAITRSLLKLRPLGGFQGLVGTQSARSAGNWNKDWKPGKYPVTPEERAAAARKYGLRPDEYEPYPDDGLGFGDYPKLPVVSAEARDPYRDWDHPEHRRDFGEPIHASADMYGLDRIDDTQKPRFSLNDQALSFFGVMAAFFAAYFYLNDNKMHWPVLPKQYPEEGKTHYTFEPAE